jgi:hypothetical protein
MLVNIYHLDQSVCKIAKTPKRTPVILVGEFTILISGDPLNPNDERTIDLSPAAFGLCARRNPVEANKILLA